MGRKVAVVNYWNCRVSVTVTKHPVTVCLVSPSPVKEAPAEHTVNDGLTPSCIKDKRRRSRRAK